MQSNQFLLFCLIFLGIVVSGQTGDVDWSKLGVDATVVGSIVTITQWLKRLIPASYVVLVPIGLSILAFFVLGYHQDGNALQVVFWAAAAAYLYDIATKGPLEFIRIKKSL